MGHGEHSSPSDDANQRAFAECYLKNYGPHDERVFYWTVAELQAKIDIGEGERIPLLEELIILSKDAPDMLLNIELKGPLDPVWGQMYDYDLAAREVIKLIEKYDIASRTMISSFVRKIVDSVIKIAESQQSVEYMI